MNAPLDLFPLKLSFEPPKPNDENDSVQVYWYLIKKENDEYVIRNIKYDVLLRHKNWNTLLKKAKWTFPKENKIVKKTQEQWEALPVEVVGDLPSVQKLAHAEEQDYEGVLVELRKFKIQDQDGLDFAAEMLAEIKGKYKLRKTELDKVIKPLNAVIKVIRSWFSPGMNYLKEAEELLKEMIAAYNDKLFKEQQRALKVAADASMDGEDEQAEVALVKAKAAKVGKIEGLSYREEWDFEITDFDKVPRAYLVVDEALVKKKIRKKKGKISIGGLRIFRVTKVASRSK